ncbi:MAG: DUF2147 domain-containing protein [Pseudomonadota bacterium]
MSGLLVRGLAAAATLVALAGSAGAESGAVGPVGTWKTATNDEGRYLHVVIASCSADPALLCGTVAAAFGGADQSTVGKPILWDMASEGDGRWSGGRVWAPDDDNTYRAKMQMKNAATLELSGCVLGGLICRGQDWTRVAPGG